MIFWVTFLPALLGYGISLVLVRFPPGGPWKGAPPSAETLARSCGTLSEVAWVALGCYLVSTVPGVLAAGWLWRTWERSLSGGDSTTLFLDHGFYPGAGVGLAILLTTAVAVLYFRRRTDPAGREAVREVHDRGRRTHRAMLPMVWTATGALFFSLGFLMPAGWFVRFDARGFACQPIQVPGLSPQPGFSCRYPEIRHLIRIDPGATLGGLVNQSTRPYFLLRDRDGHLWGSFLHHGMDLSQLEACFDRAGEESGVPVRRLLGGEEIRAPWRPPPPPGGGEGRSP